MKKMIWIALASFGAMAANAATLHETFDRTFAAKPGGTLVLSNVNGRVTIHSSAEAKIVVHADKSVDGGDQQTARRAMNELTIEATATDGGAKIVTHEPQSAGGGFWNFLMGEHVETNVTYDVVVPSTFDIDVSNVNGAILVTEVSGKQRIETTNGRIELARCAGSFDVSTTNGSIRAELLQVGPGRDQSFETTNGRISLVVPASLAAEIDAETTNGSITTDLPVTTKSFESNSLRGTVGGGGPRLRLRTTNGSVEIRTTAKQSAAR